MEMNRNILIAVGLVLAALALSGGPFFITKYDVISAGNAVPPPPPPFAAFGPDCEIAAVSKDHLFVAASVYQGDTLTNVQLGDPAGETTMVRIAVVSGAQPITVLLQSSQPVIFSFEGAVERVARAIIIPGYRDRVAVSGLPAAKVDIPKLARCPAQSIPFEKNNARRRDEILLTLFGRQPDRVATHYSPNSIELPDLQPGSSPTKGPERTAETDAEKSLLTYFPGGFRIVDAKSLVSRAEVLTPETYPDAAGLIQLERAGAIRPARREEIDSFAEGLSRPFRSKLSPNYRINVSFSYVILRDVMLPAGLHGAHSKNFLVLSGVPAPRGNVGHGCLAFMDGFKADERCYGEAWDGIERLKKLPDANTAPQCRLLVPPADASVEAVSIYEPKGAKHSYNSTRVPSPVDIKVNKSGAVLLVLNTYEPAIWRISASEATQIAGVILIGYYASKVEGIAPDTLVLQIDYEGRKNRPPVDPSCEPLHGYLGSNFRGGPAAMVLDRQIGTLTGKGIDGLRGAYALDRVEIQ
jgi:hypothetical protein